MKSRTRKLAWLLSATMVFTSVNPGMMAMASEENDVIALNVEEQDELITETAVGEEAAEGESTSELDGDLIEDVIDQSELVEETEKLLDVEEYAIDEDLPIVAQEADVDEKTITSITPINEKTKGYVNLDTGMFYGSVIITYDDETTVNGYISGNAVYVRGNEDNSRLSDVSVSLWKSGDNETDYMTSGGVKEGIYELVISQNEKVLYNSGYIYQLKSLEELPVLNTEGTTHVKSNSNPNEDTTSWYKFVPTKTARYYFSTGSDINYSVWKEREGNTPEWYTNGAFNAEKGENYYIQFNGYVDNDLEKVYEWDTEISEILEIKSISDITPRRDAFAENIEDDIFAGTTMKITYTDGSSENVTAESRWSATDSQGNYIGLSVEKQNDSDWTSGSEFTTGNYKCIAYVDGKTVAESDYIFRVVQEKNTNYTELSMGDNEVTSGVNYHNWYRFTPTIDGKYVIQDQGSIYVKDSSGTEVDSLGNWRDYYNVFELKKDQHYYVGISGRYNEEVDKYESYISNVLVKLIPDVVDFSDIVLPKTEYYAEMDEIYFSGAEATVHYQDGTTEDIQFGLNSEDDDKTYLEESEQYISAYLSQNGEKVDNLDNLQPGEYTLGFDIYDDDYSYLRKIDTYYKVTIKSPTEADLPEIKIGDTNVESDHWYSFTAPETAKYRISKYSRLRILKQVADTTEKVDIEEGSFEAEKDAVYYIGFLDMLYDYDEDEEYYSWITSLFKVIEIQEIASVDLARREFVANEDWGFVQGSKIEVSYADGTKDTLEFTDTESVTDQYGTKISAYIRDSENDWWEMREELDAGEYEIRFCVYKETEDSVIPYDIAMNSDINKEDYKITVKNIQDMDLTQKELVPGKVTIESSGCTGYANWYKFEPAESGRYYFQDITQYKVCKINEEGTLDTIKATRVEDPFLVEAGVTYYIGFVKDTSCTTEFAQALTVAEIKADSIKTKFYSDIYQNHIVANIIVVYDNGTTGTIDLDDARDTYGNNYKISIVSLDPDNEEYYSIDNALPAGEYNVKIAWTADRNVALTYDITVAEQPTPFNHLLQPEKLVVGGTYQVVLKGDYLANWFQYTPQSDCTVVFQSTGNVDSYVELYDAEGNWIDEDDDSGEEYNFCLKASLVKGQTYYFKTNMYSPENGGTYNVTFKLDEQEPVHTHTYVEDRKEATCTTAGYTQQKCSSCGEVKAGSYAVIPAKGHSFGAFVETTHPTALAEGIQAHTCMVCGYSENATVGRLAANVTLSASTLPLQVKQSTSITKLITAMTTGDRLVSCTTSNKKIATVNNAGKVTGKKAGKAKITMNFASGLSKTVTVKVQKTKVATSKITNIPGSITLKVKNTYKLSPVIAPITTKDKASYKTANKKIAAVAKNGKITAKKAGKTTITVKVGKKTKKVKVTVTK